MFHNSVWTKIRLGFVGAAAALAALLGVVSTASAYETGYSSIQLVSFSDPSAQLVSLSDPSAPLCTGTDAAATITRAYPPEYPQISLEQGVEGSSLITFTMALDGSVSNAKVAGTSGNHLFDRSAVDAVQKSHFAPAMLNCSKIAGVYGLRVFFVQQNASAGPALPFVFGPAGRMIVK